MAYTFSSGSSQYLEYAGELPNGDSINNRFVAFSCWFNASSLSTGTRQPLVAFDFNYYGSHYYLEIGLQPSTDRAYARWNGAVAEATLDLSTGVWYHLFGLFEWAPSTTCTDPACYVNGGNVGTVTGSGAGINTTRSMYIGRGYNAYSSASVAEVAIWYYSSAGRNFTQAEISMLAAGYSPLLVRPQELVSYIPLVRGLNDVVWGKTFTATNSPTVSDHPPVWNISSQRVLSVPEYAPPERLSVTTAGATVALTEDPAVKATQVAAYVEYDLDPQVMVTTAGATVALTEDPAVKATQVGAYVEYIIVPPVMQVGGLAGVARATGSAGRAGGLVGLARAQADGAQIGGMVAIVRATEQVAGSGSPQIRRYGHILSTGSAIQRGRGIRYG